MLSKIPYSMNKKIDVFKKRAFCNGTNTDAGTENVDIFSLTICETKA